MRLNPSFSASCLLVLLHTGLASSQRTTFPVLPDAEPYSNGTFLTPVNSANQVFTQGQSVNITWQYFNHAYTSINLFVVYDDDYASGSIQLTGSTSDTHFVWTVNDSHNNTAPFIFRLSNALGSAAEQQGGGFASGHFWIRDPALVQASSTLSVSVATASPTISSTVISSSSATSTSSGLSSSSATNAAQAASTTPAPTSNVAVGVGAGVGGAAGVAIIAGVLAFWISRRKKQKQQSAQVSEMPFNPAADPKLPPSYMPYHATHYDPSTSKPNAGTQVSYEVSAQNVVEAPSFLEPTELPASGHGHY